MRVLASAALAAALGGCVDRGPGPEGKKIDPAYVAQHLIKAVPDDASKLDVALGGGKIIYAGNTIDKPSIAPGQTVRVTHYWRVMQPLGSAGSAGSAWTPFTLVRGAPNTADFLNLPATDMALGHPPASWKPGEIIEDVQDITLRPDWRSPTATLYVGLIATGAHGVGDRM